jgi:diadenosine tetraphosphate (Ap4A) HIT family hydrolase
MAPHETLLRFGYPDTLVHETAHWAVVLRDRQATVGSLVLIARAPVTRFPDLSTEAAAELPAVTGALESALRAAFAFDKINYLMLMMADPHVHFHVIPRYAEPRTVAGATFEDPGWPKAPALGAAPEVTEEVWAAVLAAVTSAWTV